MIESLKQRKLFIFTMLLLAVSIVMSGVQAAELSSIESFITQYSIWIGLVFVIFEYILGKTDLIKAGSTLELVINTIMGLLKKVIPIKK